MHTCASQAVPSGCVSVCLLVSAKKYIEQSGTSVLPPVLRRLFIKSVQIFESLYKFLSMELGPHILKQSLREITLPGKLTT